jgi:hypothetical protein
LETIAAGPWATNHLSIGIVEAGLIRELDANLCITGKRSAWLSAEGRAKGSDRIRGDGSVVIGSPAMA